MARKTYILVESPAGDRALVKSLAGHEGWKTVKSRVPEPPSDHCRLCAKGNWIEDAEDRERARIERMTRAELLEEAVRRASAGQVTA